MSAARPEPIDHLLQCPVCQRPFQRPVVLPCFHVACRGCVAADPLCVICKKKFGLSGPAKGQPSAHFIEHLVKKGGKALNTNVFRLCKECQSPASHYCAKCDQFMCDRCKKLHGRITTKLHEIKSIDEYKREMKTSIPCPSHHDREVEFMCNVCKIPICVDCTQKSGFHENHEYTDLATGMDAMVKADRQVIDEARTTAAELDGKLEFLRNTKSDLQETRDQVLSDIRQHVDEYLKALWEVGQKLVDGSNETFESSISFISSKIEEGSRILEDLEGYSSLGEGLFQTGDSASRFFLARQCSERIEKLTRTKFTVAADDILRVYFAANEDALASVSENQLGSIEHQRVPIPKSLERAPGEIQGEAKDKFEELTPNYPHENGQTSRPDFPTNGHHQQDKLSTTTTKVDERKVTVDRDDNKVSVRENALQDSALAVTLTEKLAVTEKQQPDEKRRPNLGPDDNDKRSLETTVGEKKETRRPKETSAAPKEHVKENDRDFHIPGAKERNIAKQKVREDSDLGEVDASEPIGFQEPRGIAVSPAGCVAVADSKNCEVKLFDRQRHFIRSFKIKRHIFTTGRFVPFDLAFVNEDQLVVTDHANGGVAICTLNGKVTKRIEDSSLHKPRGVAVDSMGRILVVDSKTRLVRVYSVDTCKYLLSFGSGDEDADGQLAEPWFVTVDSATNVLVSDSSKSCLQVFDRDGRFLHRSYIKMGSQGQQRISPCGLHCDPHGNVYITRYDSGGVYAFDAGKRFMFEFGESWQNYFGIAVDIHRPWTFYVTDKVGHSVYVFQMVEQ